MLFRRNTTYKSKNELPTQAKKSLLERLVILDADGVESPEAVAAEIEDSYQVKADVVRVRPQSVERDEFPPEPKRMEVNFTSNPRDPAENEEEVTSLSVEDLFGPKNSRVEEDPAHEALKNDLLFERESDPFADDRPAFYAPPAPRKIVPQHFDEVDVEEVSDMPAHTEQAEEIPARKEFDILDRARKQEEEERNKLDEIRIIYRVPKRAAGSDMTRNAIHNELIERINNSISGRAFAGESIEEVADEPVVNVTYPEFGNLEPQEEVNTEAVAEAYEAITGEPVEKEQVEEALESFEAQTPQENYRGWISHVEDVPEMSRMRYFEKVLFPEEYFYANDGRVIKNVRQLHDALRDMSEETYKHHAHSRGTNDFANWIKHIFGHEECARRLSVTGGKEDMLLVLGEYL